MLKELHLNGCLLASLSSDQNIAFRECKSVSASASCNSPRKRRDRQICQLWLNQSIFSYLGCRTIEAPLSDKNLMMKWCDNIRLCLYTPSLICVIQEGCRKLLQYVFGILYIATDDSSGFFFSCLNRISGARLRLVEFVCGWTASGYYMSNFINVTMSITFISHCQLIFFLQVYYIFLKQSLQLSYFKTMIIWLQHDT